MEINVEVRKIEQVLSPWVTLVTRSVKFPGELSPQDFHSLKLADYVTMFAVTANGKIPLVRQYRPALRRFSLELPSGLLDPEEDPQQAAVRELFEETGLRPGAGVERLGCLVPDSARLENRLWPFFTDQVNPLPSSDWRPEPEIENIMVSRQELKQLIADGQFDHALHIAVIGLAMTHCGFSFNTQTT